MKIQVEAVSPVEKKVTVEIDAEQVAKEIDRAYVGLGRRARLPGFRPGKVPRNVLVKNFRGEVEREVVEKLVNDSFAEAVRSEKIDAIDAKLPPIIARLNIDPSAWEAAMQPRGNVFGRAMGRLNHLQLHAKALGQSWVRGLREAELLYR